MSEVSIKPKMGGTGTVTPEVPVSTQPETPKDAE